MASAWPPEPDVIASEGREFFEEFVTAPHLGVVTDDLVWRKPRRREFAKTDAKRPRSTSSAPERPKPGLTPGLRDTPTAFEGGDDDG
jgi:hypothetical protein